MSVRGKVALVVGLVLLATGSIADAQESCDGGCVAARSRAFSPATGVAGIEVAWHQYPVNCLEHGHVQHFVRVTPRSPDGDIAPYAEVGFFLSPGHDPVVYSVCEHCYIEGRTPERPEGWRVNLNHGAPEMPVQVYMWYDPMADRWIWRLNETAVRVVARSRMGRGAEVEVGAVATDARDPIGSVWHNRVRMLYDNATPKLAFPSVSRLRSGHHSGRYESWLLRDSTVVVTDAQEGDAGLSCSP